MATKQRRTRPSVSTKKAAKAKIDRRPFSRAGKTRGSARPAKPARSAKTTTRGRTAKEPSKPARRPAGRPAGRAKQPDGRPVAASSASTRPSPRELAVEKFERGFTALQRRNFKEAASILSSILEQFPDEKELHERARVYIAVCERQAADGREAPKTVEERMNAATVAINRGDYEEALGFLRSVEREDGENDLVHYMMAVVHVGLGDADAALPCLRQAVDLNNENRYLAAQDSDLEPLREHPDFVALLESPSSPRRRPAPRARAGR